MSGTSAQKTVSVLNKLLFYTDKMFAQGVKMKCKVYPSSKKHNRYIIVPTEKGVSDLPQQAQDEIGMNESWKEVDLHPNRPLIGLDSRQALSSIESQGYHLEEVTIIFDEKE